MLVKLLEEKVARVVLLVGVGRGREADDAVRLQAVQPMLHHYVAKSRVRARRGRLVKAHGVFRLERENRARAVLQVTAAGGSRATVSERNGREESQERPHL